MGTAGAGEARQAWAHSSHANPQLPSPDTLVGGLIFDAAVAATVSISFAAAQVRFSLSVVGTEGSLEVRFVIDGALAGTAAHRLSRYDMSIAVARWPVADVLMLLSCAHRECCY